MDKKDKLLYHMVFPNNDGDHAWVVYNSAQWDMLLIARLALYDEDRDRTEKLEDFLLRIVVGCEHSRKADVEYAATHMDLFLKELEEFNGKLPRGLLKKIQEDLVLHSL